MYVCMLHFLASQCYAFYAINFIPFVAVCAVQSVRLYDASANVLRGEFLHAGPVLDCCFHDDSSGFSAAADNTVRRSITHSLTLFKFEFTYLSL